MSELFLKEAAIEVDGYQNVAYIVNNNDLFLLTEYKVLNSQHTIKFLKCAKLLYNGKIKLVYFTSNLKSLKNILMSLDGSHFLNIIASLFSSIMSIEENGFLNCGNLDLDINKIYIDQTNMTVHLIYIPIKSPKVDNVVFESDLRANLVKIINSAPNVCSGKVEDIRRDLSNGMISIADLYKSILGMPGTVVGHEVLMLESTDPSRQFSLTVNKDEFFIGRSAEKSDGVISYNNAIGRRHCKILHRDGRYAIVDLESSNGTYVNGTRIAPNTIVPVNNGDKIRLANSDFVVKV